MSWEDYVDEGGNGYSYQDGYIDDIHGWNFIGGKDGKNVSEDNLEMTRLIRKKKSNRNCIDLLKENRAKQR